MRNCASSTTWVDPVTIGPIVGFPASQFALPRSYIQRLFFASRLFPMLSGGPNFVFQEGLHPEIKYYVNLLPTFWAWNSNSYTLDGFFVDAYATIDPSPVLIPAPVYVTYVKPQSAAGSALHIDLFIVEGSYTQVSFPTRNRPYWLPDL